MSLSLRLLARTFKPNENDGFETSLELLPQAIHVLSFELSSDEDLLARARLLEQVSRCELRLGTLQSTEEFALEALGIHLSLHGGTDLQTLRCEAHLAEVLFAIGKHDEAKMHAESAISGLASIDVNGSDYLGSMDILAHIFQEMGLYDDASHMLDWSLRERAQRLEETHPSTLINMTSLASVLNNQGRLKEAEEIYQQSIDMMKLKLGTEHPNTLAANNDYASLLDSLGRYDEAGTIHRENMAIRARVQGELHPDTAASEENLANVLGHQGRYTEAAELHQQTWKKLSTMLGKENPLTLTTMANLAVALARKGRYQEASQLCTEAVQMRERVLGKDHPAIHASKGILEDIHRREKSQGKDGSDNTGIVNNVAGYQINGATSFGTFKFGGY